MTFVSELQSQFGKNGLIKTQLAIPSRTKHRIHSGSTALDIALGGGLPGGRIVQIKGLEKSYKTSLLLAMIAQAQRSGGSAAYIQCETTFDPEWVEGNGVRLDDEAFKKGEFIYPPETKYALKAMNYVEKLATAYKESYGDDGPMFLIGWDSLGSTLPWDEYDISLMDEKKDAPTTTSPGNMAREISRGIRRIADKITGTNITLVYINHDYANIGVMFGAKTVPRGGQELRYHNDISLVLSRFGESPLPRFGRSVKVTLEKSKVSLDGQEILLDFYAVRKGEPGGGLDNVSSIWSYLKQKGALKHSSSGHYSIAGMEDKYTIYSFITAWNNSGEFRDKIVALLSQILLESPNLMKKWEGTPFGPSKEILNSEDE